MSEIVCGIKTNNKFLKALGELTSNVTVRDKIFTLWYKDRTFDEGFKDWYKEKTGKELSIDIANPNLKIKEAREVANFLYEYHFTQKPSVFFTSRDGSDSNVSVYGYTSDIEYFNGVRHVGDILLQINNDIIDKGITIEGDKLPTYVALLKEKWLNYIFEDAVLKNSNKTVSDFKKGFEEADDKDKYLNTITGGTDKTKQSTNKIAVWRQLWCADIENSELNTNDNYYSSNYINEVLSSNTSLQQLKRKLDKELDKLIDISKAEELDVVGDEEEGQEKESSSTAQMSEADILDVIGAYNNHSGQTSSHLTAISERVKNYINALSVLTEAKIGSEDTSNSFGIPDTMDFKSCVKVIRQEVKFANKEQMLKDIKRVSETISGYESFAKLAYDLEHDDDFANAFQHDFRQVMFPKDEIVIKDGKSQVIQSNKRTDKKQIIQDSLFDDIKTTALSYDDYEFTVAKSDCNNDVNRWSRIYRNYLAYKGLVEKTKTEIKNGVANPADDFISIPKKQFNSLSEEEQIKLRTQAEKDFVSFIEDQIYSSIAKVTTFVRTFYPSITENAIISYITRSPITPGKQVVDRHSQSLSNLRELLSIMDETGTGSKKSKINYNNNMSEVEQATLRNEQRAALQELGNDIELSEYEDIDVLKTQDFLDSNNIAAVMKLVDIIAPYTIADTDNNTRNIYGNNTSDWLNPCHLGHIKEMMDGFIVEDGVLRNPLLEEWGRRKLAKTQYKYNNFLLEQVDDNGNIISKGLFREVNGALTLTEYSPSMLRVGFLNGSSDLDNNANAGYSKMSDGDYLPTTYLAFHRGGYKQGDIPIPNVELATYFPRTPSDAPKQFDIRMPKYSTKGLFDYADKEKAEADIYEATIRYLNIGTAEDFGVSGLSPINILETIPTESYIFPKGDLMLGPNTEQRPISMIQITDENGNGTGRGRVPMYDTYGNIIVVEGVPKEIQQGIWILTDVKYVGLINRTISDSKPFDKLNPKTTNNPTGLDAHTHIFNIIRKEIADKLEKGDLDIQGKHFDSVKKTLNMEHPVAQMLKNMVKQELLDAATASVKYFKYTVVGNYAAVDIDDDLKPFKSGKSNTVDSEGNPIGIGFYHLKDGKLLEPKKDGRGVRLLGNVFHSSKFTLFVPNEDGEYNRDEDGNIIGRNYIEELISEEINDKDPGKINILYGTQSNTHLRVILNGDPDDESNVEQLKAVDIELTKEQDKAIDRKIESFLRDYIRESANNIQSYEQFIEETELLDYNHIADYAVNYLLFYDLSDTILEGNPKFYKDTRTLFKRAKQNQGAGKALVNSDYNELEGGIRAANSIHTVANSFLNTGVIQKPKMVQAKDKDGNLRTNKDGEPIMVQEKIDGVLQYEDKTIQQIFEDIKLGRIEQRNGFRAVTIANSKNSRNATFDMLIKILSKVYQKELKMPKKAADAKAATLIYGPIQFEKYGSIKRDENGEPKRRGGFTDTKVNDAQSYITMEEWIRRLDAKGQLKRYMPLIEKIKDETQRLTSKDLKEFAQVQKNYYYDLTEDENYDIDRPRQIKNAEFILIPRFIKGTQLQLVYDIMKEAEVDQLNTVETSKASNGTILKLWDNNGDIDILDENGKLDKSKKQGFVNNFKANKENYYYKNLYSQQETPQHMDAENKAGIQLLKKLIDNIPENHPTLGQLKKDYFKLICANVDMSFADLMDELDIPILPNGELDLDEQGNIKNINLKVLYDKFRDELLRVGIDSNSLKYVTLDSETGKPIMPSYMNNFLTKFENIFNSVFNHGITRQTLKGFHAAQVTNVGFKSIRGIAEDTGVDDLNITYDKTLRYHPNGEGYIEVMVPLSFLGIDKNSAHYRNMSEEDILKELAAKKLDLILGYRIPTEGKQSMCNMKIVGLLDDAQGSTIVVPDEWVAQTGSDFDIDSIYAIQYNIYKKGNGEAIKIEYKEELDEYDYFRYVREYGDKTLDSTTKEEKRKAKERIKIIIDSEKKKIREETKNAFEDLKTIVDKYGLLDTKKKKGSQLLDNFRKKIANETKQLIAPYREKVVSSSTKYINELTKRMEKLNPNVEGYKETKEAFERTIKTHETQIEFSNGARKEDFNEDYQKQLDELVKGKLSMFEDIALSVGLMSFEEFKQSANVEKNNTKEARDNKLLDIMRAILEDKSSLEENLSRSNFDDIVRVRNLVMNILEKARRDNASSSNVFDQIQYQTDAMSGAELKALSVVLDTFCSICNTIKPTLTKPIRVVYEEDNNKQDESLNVITEANLSRNYKGIKHNKYGLEIKHTQYGWSNTNRNTADKILTAYSSQTTALILDAVKEGNIPNVNPYSFGAFKTLVNCGVAYESAIPFIMQPAITDIIRDYNHSNSVFGTTFGNPVTNVIIEKAKQLEINVTTENGFNLPINDIIAKLNERFKDKFGTLFNVGTDEEGDKAITLNSNYSIITKLINDRIQERGIFAEDGDPQLRILFDIGNILIFNRLQIIAKKINDITRVSNPDKFGAKQSIFETNEVINAIDEILYKKDKIIPGYTQKEGSFITKDTKFAKYPNSPILSVKDNAGIPINIIEAIYPGCNVPTGTTDDIISSIIKHDGSTSKYPTLHAFLRNASCTSLVLSKFLFETEQPRFKEICYGLKSVFSGNNPILTKQDYRDFQKYMLASIYNDVPIIKYNVNLRIKDGKTTLIPGKLTTDEERKRIYGYGYNPGMEVMIPEFDENNKLIGEHIGTFEVADINNPTEDELKIWDYYSPAQKVAWIKAHYDEPGIFSYIETSLFNPAASGKAANTQRLQFTEESVDTNHVYNLFKVAYRNKNPLLVSAALDVIKYASQVEGFRMSKKAVMKVISNDILIENDGNNGIGFVDSIEDRIQKLNGGATYFTTESLLTLYENYLRSNPNVKQIKTTKLTKKKKEEYGLNRPTYGGMHVLFGTTAEYTKKLSKLGIAYEHSITGEWGVNKYIRLVDVDGTNRLYRINCISYQENGAPARIILYPLSNLRPNENATWSINAKNNRKILNKGVYQSIVEDMHKEFTNDIFQRDYIRKKIEEWEAIQSEQTNRDVSAWYRDNGVLTEVIPTKPFSIEALSSEKGGSWTTLKNKIINHFRPGVSQALFVRDQNISEFIKTEGELFASHQEITRPDGSKINVRIVKYSAQGKTQNDTTSNNWYKSIDYNYLFNVDMKGNYKEVENPETIPSPSLKQIVKDAIRDKHGNKTGHIYDLFYIVPDVKNDEVIAEDNSSDDSAKARTLLDCESDTIGYANRTSRRLGDVASHKFTYAMYQNNVTRNTDSIKEQKSLVSRETAKYIHSRAAQIRSNFNIFRPDPDDILRIIKMDEDKALAICMSDKKAEDDYLTNILEANTFIKEMSIYDDIVANPDDEEEKTMLNSIREDIEQVKRLPITICKDKYNHRKAEDISRNPLIRENFIDVMDGFWKTYGDAWRFNDIAENGTPFVQIMLKDVLGNLDAKRMASIRQIKEFRRRITEFKRKAAEKGLPFRVEKMVDEHGRWIQDYKSSFADKMSELYSAVDNAAKEHSLGSIQHLKAKLNYEKFKAVYCHQQALPDYYVNKCLLLEELITYNPKLAEKYFKKYYERMSYYDYITSEGIAEDKLQKINQLTYEMWQMRDTDNYIDETGSLASRKHATTAKQETKVSDIEHSDSAVLEAAAEFLGNEYTVFDFNNASDADALNSIEAAVMLNNYCTEVADLEREYFNYDAAFGFEDTLNKNLKIISDYERRGPDGELLRPLPELMKYEDYVNAKNWIATNARYVLINNGIAEINGFNLTNATLSELKEAANIKPSLYSSVIRKAKAILKLSGYGTPSQAITKLRIFSEEHPIVDSKGRLDGRLLTDDERQTLKIIMDNYYHNDLIPQSSDRRLLSNSQPENEVFTKTFYDKLRGSSEVNVERIKVINKLNNKLKKYYNEATKTIDFFKIPDNEEGIKEIQEIGALYQELRGVSGDNHQSAETKKWIKENVDFVTNVQLLQRTINGAALKSIEWKQALVDNILFELEEDGTVKANEDGEFIPNKYLFSYARPKEEVKHYYEEKEKQEALEIIKNAFTTTILPAYYEAKHEAEQNGNYEEWFDKNHVYNPYTKRYEALPCWLKREYNSEYLDKIIPEMNSEYDALSDDDKVGKWIPNISQTEKTVKEDKANPYYDPNIGIVQNYVKGQNNGFYDSNTDLNEVEREARDYMMQKLIDSAHNRQGQGYFKHGYLPKELIAKEMNLKTGGLEILKLFGIGVATQNGNKPWFEKIDYANDVVPIMPMTSELSNKQTVELEEKIQKFRDNAPTREQCNSDEEFERRKAENEESIANLQEQLKELRNSLMDRDWLKVIENYLVQSARFNAVQENKQRLYYLQEELKRMKMYNRTHGLNGDLKTISHTDDENVYDMSTDKNLIEQLEVTMRRIILDQWKQSEGKVTQFANALQSFTSANYMTFNIRGGIANVTLGLTGILSERVAKEYFEHWRHAAGEWRRGIISYGRRAYNEAVNGDSRSYSKQDAIFKYFKVVDYDELTGLIKERDLKAVSESLRNFTYSPQTIGEHYMQNSVLIAMLMSHKLVNTETGLTYMNKGEYLRYKQGEMLKEILSEEQREEFDKFKKEQKEDKNKQKDYAWFRKNLLTEWVYLHCSKNQIKEFINKREEVKNKYVKEFDKLQDMYSQFKLGDDGDMAFVEGSQLEALHNQWHRNSDVTAAEQLLGNFAERVRKVNNKIHGVYNRNGAAYIEKNWWGSLVMQYHKHLPIGLLKRYRSRGYFNEFRGTVEKGLLQSIIDFVALDWRKVKAEDPNITDEQLGALQGLQYFMLHAFDFFSRLKTTWYVLPDEERANIARNLGDFVGTIGAIVALVGLWYIADDDDEWLDSLGWNMAVYEMDRLASESFMYNPWGLMSETKKLMSTPVAAQSIVSDAFSSMVAVFNWLIGDEDYDMNYQSGRFAGQNKLWVYIKRRIPMWSSIQNIFDTTESNHYYKLGQTGTTIFGNPKNWASDFRGHEVGKRE